MRLAAKLAIEGEQEIAHASQRHRQFEAKRQPQNQADCGIEGPGMGDSHLRRRAATYSLRR